MTGRTLASVLAIAVALSLAGCSTPSAGPTPSPSPTPAVSHSPAQLIGGTVEPVGTTWSGTDSAGDVSSFTLKPDHGVKVSYGAHSFDQQGDSWNVTDGTLALHVYIDASNGYLDYTSVWDAATETLSATGTTSLSKRSVTVTLAQK